MSGIALMRDRPPYIRFAISTEEDRNASIEAGRYMARDVEMVNIMPAGSKDIVEREATAWLKDLEARARMNPPQYNPEWASHFRACYDAWKKGIELPTNGTPIRNWSLLSPAQIENLVSCHVLTIEDLAEANEELMRHLGMGSRDLKTKALAYLEQANGSGAIVQRVAKLEIDLEEMLRQNAEKDGLIRTLQAELESANARAGAGKEIGGKRTLRDRAESVRDTRDVV